MVTAWLQHQVTKRITGRGRRELLDPLFVRSSRRPASVLGNLAFQTVQHIADLTLSSP